MAAALGATAFSLQATFVDEPAVIDSDVKPVYDFEAAPARTLSTDWGGELPAAIRRDTDIGHQLLETALTKTEQSSESTPYLYDEEGQPVVSRDDLEAATQIDTAEEKSYWVVPGVVQRYTISLPDGPKTQLSCECRSLTTPHVFTGWVVRLNPSLTSLGQSGSAASVVDLRMVLNPKRARTGLMQLIHLE